MNLLNLTIKDNIIQIPGTNQFLDFFISVQCWPKEGWHAGIKKRVDKECWNITDKLDILKPVTILGHSMGGAAAQYLGNKLLLLGYDVRVEAMGAYPVLLGTSSIPVPGICKIYGNDPVPGLFSWFRFTCPVLTEGPERKWWKVLLPWNLGDHLKYEGV